MIKKRVLDQLLIKNIDVRASVSIKIGIRKLKTIKIVDVDGLEAAVAI